MGKIPKYTDNERLMTAKTDYLLTDEGEESISMDFQVCRPQKTRVLCHLKMLPVTELMNIPDATFVKSTQTSATTEQTQHH